MEKRLGGGSDHGGGMSWGHAPPHFLVAWRSKEVAVQLYMLTATAACYGKFLTRPISRGDCRASNYLTQL